MKHRVSKVPVEQIPASLRATMEDVDSAIGGSEWMQVFAHAPEMYGDFVKFYYDHATHRVPRPVVVRLSIAKIT